MAIENNQIQNMNSDNDEISLKELIFKIKEWASFLKTKQKNIFIAVFIGALIGLTYAFFEKPTYKAGNIILSKKL
jgi:LPS O-antigen subunit length determinant protein (WzzB/FepE family)